MLATSAKDNPLNWEEYLQPVCFAYNTSIHSSTGFTPFYLMYGREARLPVDLHFGINSPNSEDLSTVAYSRQMQMILNYAYQKVRSTLGNIQQRQKTLYDQHVHGTPYKEGDMVWLYSTVIPSDSHRKLYHPWTGPYKVISKLSDLNYKIAPVHDLCKTSIVHFDRLKRCHSSFQSSSPLSHSPPSQTLLSQANHNIGKEAELLDFPDENHVHNAINDTPPDEINISDSEISSPGDLPNTSNDISLSSSPPPTPPPTRYPTRHRLPPDRGPFISH